MRWISEARRLLRCAHQRRRERAKLLSLPRHRCVVSKTAGSTIPRRLCLLRIGALNFVEAERGGKNVNTKSLLIDLLFRFWRYRFDGRDLPPVLRMPFRWKRRALRDDSSIW
jgi:hypothetical protein